MLTPRQYQVDGIAEARKRIAAGTKRLLLVMATGGGKTVVAALIAEGVLAKQRRALFLAHRREIIAQTWAKLVEAGIPAEHVGVIMADGWITHPVTRGRFNALARNAPMQVASVQTLVHRTPPPADVVFVDEAHHARAKTYQTILDHYIAAGAVVVGLTATPIRQDGRGLGELFDDILVVRSFRELAAAGFLVVPRVYTHPEQPDVSGVHTVAGEFNQKEIAAVVDRPKIVGNIVEHWLSHAEDRSTVVFAASVEHSRHVVDAFNAAGIRAEHVDAETPADERDAILGRLADGSTTVLGNMGVCAEGWDCLDEETEILTAAGWRGRGAVVAGDLIYALNRETEHMEIVSAEQYGERTVRPDERMVEIRGQSLNIRTTEGHRFFVKYRDSQRHGARSAKFLERTGTELAGRSSAFVLPLAAETDEPFPGVPLSDDELRFVAWFMTDGGFEDHGRSVTINQSKRHIDEIRALLVRLGLDFKERVRENRTGYPNASPLHEFRIPKGTGTIQRAGWFARFSAYLDKNVAAPLHAMTRAQFSVFWTELLKGDGEKQGAKAGWLWCDRVAQANAYTQMAVLRGFASSYSTRTTDTGHTMYRLSVRDRQWITSDPGDARASKIALAPARDGEIVWCVTNRLGTLVTRRGGKVAILGNCPRVKCIVLARPTKSLGLYLQMAGRGLRPHEDTPAILLDHAGNALRHGLPQEDRAWTLDKDRKRDAKPPSLKVCPRCQLTWPMGTVLCDPDEGGCGYVWQGAERTGPAHEDGSLRELTEAARAQARHEEARTALKKAVWRLACERVGVPRWTHDDAERDRARSASYPINAALKRQFGARDTLSTEALQAALAHVGTLPTEVPQAEATAQPSVEEWTW